METARRILIIAGPNGAGKTVFATEFLPNEANCPTFINADLIAAGLSPFRPHLAAVGAGRLMLSMMRDYVRRGESFAFETTLSGRGYVRSIRCWQEQGFSSCGCGLLRWLSRASNRGLRRVVMMCRNLSFVGGFMRDGTISEPFIGIW